MIRKYSFPSPVVPQAGDTFERVAGYLLQMRGNTVVQSWRLADLESSELTSFEVVGNQITSLLLEVAMPGQNVSMTKVTESATGVITFSFSSGANSEYPSWESVAEIADAVDAVPDLAEKILIGKAYRASPDGTNKTTQVGVSVSCNLLASEPIVYTEAQ